MYGSGGADPEGNRPGDLYVVIKVKLKASMVILFVRFLLFSNLIHFIHRGLWYSFFRSEKTPFSGEKALIFM